MWHLADLAWNGTSIARRAFSAPWSGSPEQWAMVYTGLCLAIVIGLVLYAWRRDGGDVVLQRFRDMPRQIAMAHAQRGQPVKARLLNLALWIVITLALVVYFNWYQQTGR